MYHGTRLNCHSEERSDVGISCNSPRIRRGFPTIRLCTAEIAASACGLLAMTYQGSMAPGTVHCTELAVRLPLRGRAGHAPPGAMLSIRTDYR